MEFENDILIVCSESRLDYSEEKENGKIISRRWSSKKSTEFRISYIRWLIIKIKEIIMLENYLINKLEDYGCSRNL